MTGVIAALAIVAVLAVQAAVVARLRRGQTPSSDPLGAGQGVAHAQGSTTRLAVGDLAPEGGWLVRVLRRRRWLRRSLSFASVAVTLIAVGMMGYPFYTNLYANRVQDRLEQQFTSPELRADYATCQQTGIQSDQCQIEEGDSLTRIQIPDIQVDVVVVEGVGASALRAGAGHYPSTPLPCEPGNVSIAGHRTTYGRPFHDLDRLEPGDEIHLQTPIGGCTYRVVNTTIHSPNDVGVIAGTGDDRLTLTTCHPKGSARQRLVVTAELVSATTTEA